ARSMPSLWPPSGLVPKPETMRPFTGQRKLLPDMGSGVGSCSLVATCGVLGVLGPGALGPVVSFDAATGAAGGGASFFGAPLAFAVCWASSSAREVPGAGILVVFTTCTSGLSLGVGALVSSLGAWALVSSATARGAT